MKNSWRNGPSLPTWFQGAFIIYLLGCGLWSCPVSQAQNGPVPTFLCFITASELFRMCPSELEERFACGCVGEHPVGAAFGRVLLVPSSRAPRLRAQAMNTLWKGKYFFPDGDFTNLWLGGVQAVPSEIKIGPSWFDSKPCFILEYPPGSPVFANTRDEFREVAPGLFLGRFYERCPCPRFQGFFVLQLQCK